MRFIYIDRRSVDEYTAQLPIHKLHTMTVVSEAHRTPFRPAQPSALGAIASAALLSSTLLALPLPGVAAPLHDEAAADVPTLAEVTVSGAAASDVGVGPVTGYVAEQSRAGTKTPTSILETPQSISVITREQMDVQQSASTSQALRYTAGAYSEKYGGFGGQLDLTRIRGIDADYYLDGLRMITNVSTWTCLLYTSDAADE